MPLASLPQRCNNVNAATSGTQPRARRIATRIGLGVAIETPELQKIENLFVLRATPFNVLSCFSVNGGR